MTGSDLWKLRSLTHPFRGTLGVLPLNRTIKQSWSCPRVPNGFLKQSRQSARRAGLLYVDEAQTAGIRRERSGRSFRYLGPSGRVIRAALTLSRIETLVIPPAWEDVWICADAHGHLQATGRDQRGRKQYLYHARWREVRDATKFDKMIDFAAALPRIRKRVNADLRRRGTPREKVLAAIVKLLETTLIRVGNEVYARINRTFGLTTMKNRHVSVRGKRIQFNFIGKSGIRHAIDFQHQQLARIVAKCQELPGQRLFQYTDAEETAHDISSHDVNQYLRDISGQDFTAKDFRTWAATLMAMESLQECSEDVPVTTRRRIATSAVKAVAKRLGNTVAVCRKSYIHPFILRSYLEGTLPAAAPPSSRPPGLLRCRLSAAERQVVELLRKARKND